MKNLGDSTYFRLGSVGFADRLDGLRTIRVANMIAQIGLRGPLNPVPLCYTRLRECLVIVSDTAETTGSTVVMPRIGCGLAGGVWEHVSQIIQEELCDYGIKAVVYDLP
jgi:hypothetical protein